MPIGDRSVAAPCVLVAGASLLPSSNLGAGSSLHFAELGSQVVGWSDKRHQAGQARYGKDPRSPGGGEVLGVGGDCGIGSIAAGIEDWAGGGGAEAVKVFDHLADGGELAGAEVVIAGGRGEAGEDGVGGVVNVNPVALAEAAAEGRRAAGSKFAGGVAEDVAGVVARAVNLEKGAENHGTGVAMSKEAAELSGGEFGGDVGVFEQGGVRGGKALVKGAGEKEARALAGGFDGMEEPLGAGDIDRKGLGPGAARGFDAGGGEVDNMGDLGPRELVEVFAGGEVAGDVAVGAGGAPGPAVGDDGVASLQE